MKQPIAYHFRIVASRSITMGFMHALACLLVTAPDSFADIWLDPGFGDNMVLQKPSTILDKKLVAVSGMVNEPKESIKVRFEGPDGIFQTETPIEPREIQIPVGKAIKKAKTESSFVWEARWEHFRGADKKPFMPERGGPYTVTITSQLPVKKVIKQVDSKVLTNVVIGDVFVIGITEPDPNRFLPVKTNVMAQGIAEERLRFFKADTLPIPQTDHPEWKTYDGKRENFDELSHMAYYFGVLYAVHNPTGYVGVVEVPRDRFFVSKVNNMELLNEDRDFRPVNYAIISAFAQIEEQLNHANVLFRSNTVHYKRDGEVAKSEEIPLGRPPEHLGRASSQKFIRDLLAFPVRFWLW